MSHSPAQLQFAFKDTVVTLPVIGPDFDWDCLLSYPAVADSSKRRQPVHIVASGPSIQRLDISQIQHQPTIFVNGSFKLTADHGFSHMVAYVITDPRFIQHNLNLLLVHYQGQCPLLITQPVLLALKTVAAGWLQSHQHSIHIIYAVDRPIKAVDTAQQTPSLVSSITRPLKRLFNKTAAAQPINSAYHRYNQQASSLTDQPIGVALDIRYGFVEAGTVTYVATQLAYSLGFKDIVIHGMDLCNSDQPRFYENKDSAAPCKLDKAIENRIVPSFDWLAQTYADHGTSVSNGSDVSKDLFKTMPYQAGYLTTRH